MSIPQKTALRILSLEDSALDAELILGELSAGGVAFVSRRVQTRQDFVRELAGFQPDIVLADYRLPDFEGAEALALVMEHSPDTPVIIISGAVGEETAVELLKNGATDFVLKNRLPRLVGVVRRAMREVAERSTRRQAEADLLALNEKLERMVVERTQELSEKNALMEEDLVMARELQFAILPHHYPALPRGVAQSESALKFCNIFRPSSFLSGDFFNVVRVSDTAVGILICDVMGHGVRSAIVAAMIRALEEQLRELADEPGRLLTEINRAMCAILQHTGNPIFATAFFLIIDIASARISFASAGHPSPLLITHNPEHLVAISTQDTMGPALGIFEAAQYSTHQLQLSNDSLILLFTDGLFEVENPQGDIFSQERLVELVLTYTKLPPPELMSSVFSQIESFTAGRAFSDDVCLVGIEIAHLVDEISQRGLP